MFSIRLVVCCAVVAAACSALALAEGEQPVSFIVNGSFEQQKDGKPVGWRFYTLPARDDVSNYLGLSKERAHDGEWALKLDLKEPLKNPKNPDEACLALFDGAVSNEILKHKGKQFMFSAWIYVEEAAKPERIIFRVRMYGTNEKGPRQFLGDLITLYARGEPGKWVRVEQTGLLDPQKAVTDLNLQCGWIDKNATTTCYVDDLQLVVKEEPKAAGGQ